MKELKKVRFGDTHFRDICSGFNGKWHRKSWKEFDQLKDIDKSIIAQIIMMLASINIVLNVENH